MSAAAITAELDGIPCPHARARRLAELIRGWITCWPDTYAERGYRQTLEFAADDLEGDANILERKSLESEAEERYEQMRRRMPALLATQAE